MRLLFQKVSHPIVIGPTIAKKRERKKVRMTARNKLPIISAKKWNKSWQTFNLGKIS